MYEYKAKLLRIVDGDTVDVLIDVGFSTFKKERIGRKRSFRRNYRKFW